MSSISKPLLRLVWLGCVALGVLLLAGCMSDPYEGDMPWAPTATWEGSPFLPGGMMGSER